MITMTAETQVDRDITVTVSLTFKESDLRARVREGDLNGWLSNQFRSAVVRSTPDAYDALHGLRP